MALPLIILMIAEIPSNAVFAYHSTQKVKKAPYVAFAYYLNISRRNIRLHYIIKNILPDLWGRLNIQTVMCIMGSMFVEAVFSYPGLGSLLKNAASYRDYTMMQGILLVTCLYGIAVNLIYELVLGRFTRNSWKEQVMKNGTCIMVLSIYFFIAAFAPLIMPYEVTDFSHPSLAEPCRQYLLGTDEMGHDIFSLLIYGFRLTVCMALAAGFFSTLTGTVLAFCACYLGKAADHVITMTADLFIIVPEMVIVMFAAVFAEPTMINTELAIILFSWPRVYKIIRGKLKDCMNSSKVQYTMMMKGSIADVLQKLMPDIMPSVQTYFILQTNKAVTYETTLSFFGIGDPLAKTWGKLIRAAMDYENLYYDRVFLWYFIPVILVVVVFVVSLALLVHGGE